MTPEQQAAAKQRFNEKHPNAGRRGGGAPGAAPAAPVAASAPAK
jgi:hypothetical protein